MSRVSRDPYRSRRGGGRYAKPTAPPDYRNVKIAAYVLAGALVLGAIVYVANEFRKSFSGATSQQTEQPAEVIKELQKKPK